MRNTIRAITVTTLSLGLLQSCSTGDAMERANAQDRDAVTEESTPVFGHPGIDFPAPFYIGEMNSRMGTPGWREDKKSAEQNAEDETPKPSRRYSIGSTGTDWNKERRRETTTHDQTVSRSAAPRRSTSRQAMNKEPVGDMYGSAPSFPADSSVNVANLAEADLISRFHLANQREIELGRLAEERGNSSWVRSLGRRIAMDHQYADRRLMNLTRRLELTVPGDTIGTLPASPGYDYLETASLDKLTGADFDREIVQRIERAHDEKIQMLRGAEAQMPEDSRLRQLVAKLIPIMEQHRQVAENVSEKYLDQNL